MRLRACQSARLAGLGGLLAFVTFNAGWIAGDFAQPAAFSPANDDACAVVRSRSAVLDGTVFARRCSVFTD
jgi:hypothetical protein